MFGKIRRRIDASNVRHRGDVQALPTIGCEILPGVAGGRKAEHRRREFGKCHCVAAPAINSAKILSYCSITRMPGLARSRRGPPGDSMLLGRPVFSGFRSLRRVASRRIARMRRVMLERMTPVMMMMVVMMVMHDRGGRGRVGRAGGGSSGRGSGGRRSGVVSHSNSGSKHQRRREADRRKNLQHLISPCLACEQAASGLHRSDINLR